ncbi:USP8 dimerization domain containing protein [Nitzschia inconspicua]|uniref:USP8 dimerization domain containing protein n=1 Tax=Nitzschia inconspicua TaxID=303405 RepID=A0A9K3PGM0_9STRA|nr:USP8 dimerization domain containing protein [Nitzschia inconspicua]
MVQRPMNGIHEEPRPSSNRRRLLREADENSGSIPTVSNFFPLERYYDASDKVLQSFQAAFEERRLDEAYVFGMRYSQFCMEGIRKHDYFNAQKFIARKTQMSTRVQDVISKLEKVAELMDIEEVERAARIEAEKQRLLEEKRKKQRLEQERIMSEFTRRMAQQKASSSAISEQSLEESALAKLQWLSQPQGMPEQQLKPPPEPELNKRVSWNLPAEPDGQLLSQISYDAGDLPPALMPPSDNDVGGSTQLSNAISPPSYNSILKQSSYFGPGKAGPTQPLAPPYDLAAKLSKKKPRTVPIRELISQTQAKHREFQKLGKIQISPLKTYQGRVSGSTNGCTVISACCVSRHLETHGGITDDQITSVIDRDCVPLLRTIRSNVGLGTASMIIPSDVHDYLVDKKLLYQHKFVGAAGGNIVDPEHSGEMIKLLHGEPGKTSQLKAGATLFFRDHVVSIVKYPTSTTDAIYDMIDSLPFCNGMGCRTRCHGLDALKVHLAYYCTKKFSDTNITYIEKHNWEDSMADFDPRVFQAFVWADLPKPSSN